MNSKKKNREKKNAFRPQTSVTSSPRLTNPYFRRLEIFSSSCAPAERGSCVAEIQRKGRYRRENKVKMSNQPKSLGRARGRARGSVPPKPEGQIVQPAPLQGAWARRPGIASSESVAAGSSIGRARTTTPPVVTHPIAPEVSAPQQPVVQREETVSGGAGGGGGDASGLGRGALRGRRVINPEALQTRPQDLPTKKGTDGNAVSLQANYFKMLTTTDWCLYKYRVDFAPEEDRIVVRKGMLKLHKEILGAYIFDGTLLYTSNRLPEPLQLFSQRLSDDVAIKIDIRLVGDMVRGDENYLQFFNIIMRKCLEYLNLQLVGRNYFDARNKIEVHQYRLELWPGYETSIRQHEADILMCAEITHKVMRQETLLDILNNLYNRYGESYQERFQAAVIGVTVLTDYNNNTYRIDDVDFEKSPRSTFLRKNEEITYEEYYRTKYQIPIRHKTQPLLMSRSKARDRRAGMAELVYLVPELCRATGLTDDMRTDHTMMRELANHTRVNPQSRIQRLLSFNQRLHREPSVIQELKGWNMKLDEKLVTLPGRILPVENIIFGRNTSAPAGDQADWTRELRNKQMLQTVPLTNWVLIVPNRLVRDSQEFIGAMQSAVSRMQFQISQPKNFTINDDRANSYTSAIEEIMSRANPQLIMCVVPNNRADRYSAIKKKCCIDRPIPTQCILGKNLNGKGVASIATKVAVQLNCKLGGVPWTTHIPAPGLMVAGFDVCHDTNSKGRDFGALVASLDAAFGRYFSAVSAHATGEELSNDLATNMCKAVHKYKEYNKVLPSRIVMYRDGVGEGQIPYVYEHEVQNLRNKLAALYPDPSQLRLAYILVTKRLNTRLFYRGNNPPPGTIVDDIITSPIKYDFFIVSQFIKQGTVSPTGYNVLYDNAKLNPSQLQKLTYKLTHMYFNWSGTVRVPAPCQFAHKLAFLVSQSIHASPSNHLETLLYFL